MCSSDLVVLYKKGRYRAHDTRLPTSNSVSQNRSSIIEHRHSLLHATLATALRTCNGSDVYALRMSGYHYWRQRATFQPLSSPLDLTLRIEGECATAAGICIPSSKSASSTRNCATSVKLRREIFCYSGCNCSSENSICGRSRQTCLMHSIPIQRYSNGQNAVSLA